MKTLEQFLDTFLGGSWGYPDVNHFKGECLSICKIYIKECFGIEPPPSGTNSAYGYWSNFPNPLGEKFEKVLNTDDLIPEKGWIAIWKPWASNPYGHIAIVADGCTTGTLKNYAQNWTSKTFQLESNRYTNVIGFLKPKSIISDMTEEEKKLLGLIKENGLTEGDLRWVADLKEKQTVPNLEKKVTELEGSIRALEEQIGILEAKFTTNEVDLESCQKQLKTANSKIDKLNETISNITEEKNTWQTRYNNKNTDYNNLADIFEMYKKTHPESIPAKFNLRDFIKCLLSKWKK